MTTGYRLLGPDDPSPVAVENPQGTAPFLLIGDHAGDAIPRILGDLGVSAADRARHIAIDIGVRAMGIVLAGMLDAVFIHQRYSRLVVDCNRDPVPARAIVPVSDGTAIPANQAMPEAEAEARIAEIHAPYQDAIAAEIARRTAAGQPVILIALHSFTPVMAGFARPWQIGILHHAGDPTYARTVLGRLGAIPGLVVGDNEPYQMDGTDHTVPRHAYPDLMPYAEIEVRQDLLGDAEGQRRMAEIIRRVLSED